MENLKFITGLRVSSWEYKAENGIGNREFDNELTPYYGIVYDIDENHSVYTSYTSIFKPQNNKNINNQYIDPIDGKSYELGMKGEYFDGNLNTYLSIFRIEQDNVAQKIEPTIIIPGTIEQAYETTKGVTSKGFEIGISGSITDNLSLDFGLANFEAKDNIGNKVNTDSSRTTANLWTKYTIKV